jgi:ribose-phosphate pyrophosphokinase|tara:strand:+ start:14517 stop:15464 length:948 start_codon:yes stop_codon:yes gene_type:complete
MKNLQKGPLILSGNAHSSLAKEISEYIGQSLTKAEVFKFNNDNTFVRILENVRERDVFIIQPTSFPVNDNIMELLIMIDAAKRASAGRITAVIPYFSYARTDKKDQPRVPITGRLIADLITTAGADRVMLMDLHAGQVQGFFSSTVDELTALPILARYFFDKKIDNIIVVSPDTGGTKRARDFASKLRAPLAIIEKRRIGNNDKVESLNIIGSVEGMTAIVFDDEINTGGTMISAGEILIKNGAEQVYVSATHGIFPNDSLKKLLDSSDIKEVVVTNTLPIEHNHDKLTILSISELIGEAIKRINRGDSVGALFM